MTPELALLSALLSGLFALAQRESRWFLAFAWLSYVSLAPVVLVAARKDWVSLGSLVVSLAFLLNVTLLLGTFSKAVGPRLRDLEGVVSKYPAEGWLLVLSLLALTALPPFASFTLVETVLSSVPGTSALMLTATRVLWLAAFARPAVVAMLRVEGVEAKRTPVLPVSAVVFLASLLLSLLLIVCVLR